MYEIKIIRRFAAAHKLRGYRGQCEKVHGHTFKVEIKVQSRKLDHLGLVMDFHDFKALADDVITCLDHELLNELAPFQKTNPSSENLAHYIYDELKNPVRKKGAKLTEVTVWESEDSAASYYPG